MGCADDPEAIFEALVRFSAKMRVPAEAANAEDAKLDAQMAEFHRQLQAALERVTRFAEENVARVGSTEFPTIKG